MLKYGTSSHSHHTACIAADNFFPYLPRIITTMRGCVACSDLWFWPISSRSFSCTVAIKWFLSLCPSIHPSPVPCSRVPCGSLHISWIIFIFNTNTSLMPCLPCGSLHISWIIFIFSTNTTYKGVMSHVIFPGQYVKGQGRRQCSKFHPCPLHCSETIWWVCFICGTNTTYEWIMCHLPFSDQ